MNIRIEVTGNADDAVKRGILSSLLEYNEQQTGLGAHSPLVVTLKERDDRVSGGLVGRTALGWLHIELLFVPEQYRGRGIGTQLMQRAESEAIERGCHSAWLDTFQFQARGFYERLGYRCFGQLENYPTGFARYYMKKELST